MLLTENHKRLAQEEKVGREEWTSRYDDVRSDLNHYINATGHPNKVSRIAAPTAIFQVSMLSKRLRAMPKSRVSASRPLLGNTLGKPIEAILSRDIRVGPGPYSKAKAWR